MGTLYARAVLGAMALLPVGLIGQYGGVATIKLRDLALFINIEASPEAPATRNETRRCAQLLQQPRKGDM